LFHPDSDAMEKKEVFKSDLSSKEFPASERISAKAIRHSVLRHIQRDYPHISHESNISREELQGYRKMALSEYLKKELGELKESEMKVLSSVAENQILSDKVDDKDLPETFGQKVADKVATFGGSWTFILSFAAFLVIWIGINVFILTNREFDPYPFILLNLILSCLAAIQAPVIMMSQNRQEEKDRERAKNDYMINLKAELEIRTLHEKLDHLMTNQYTEISDRLKVLEEKNVPQK